MAFARLVLGVAFATALACSVVAPAEARPAHSRQARGKPPSGIEFMMRAVGGNLAAIRLGELAQKKGQNEGLRSFGEQLAAEHKEANQRAAAVAEALKFAPPREPGPRNQSQYAMLSAFSGPAFDRQFLNYVIMNYTRAMVDYQRATGRKGEAADYAKETLPMLQRHLRSAERLMRNLRWTGEPRK
jgi:putative membrane protein